MTTPKLIRRGIKWLVESEEEGISNSRRVIEDCDKVLDSMWTVNQHDSAIVQGLTDRNWTRYTKEGTLQHGGVRKKGAAENENWLHRYARMVKVEK